MKKSDLTEFVKRMEPLKPDAMGKLTGGFTEVAPFPSAVGMENGGCSGNKSCKDNEQCGNNKACENNASCYNHENCIAPPKTDDKQKKEL